MIGVWITLSNGYAALVDREDAHMANFKWCADVRRRKTGGITVYAKGWMGSKKKEGGRSEYLHRAILGFPASQIDHRDGYGLNCTRENMRLATRAENNRNLGKRLSTSSRFKGVYWHAQAKKWATQITVDGKTRGVGVFREEADAAQAYNFVAERLFGEFARLNVA